MCGPSDQIGRMGLIRGENLGVVEYAWKAQSYYTITACGRVWHVPPPSASHLTIAGPQIIPL
jgi:hypothetical protein